MYIKNYSLKSLNNENAKMYFILRKAGVKDEENITL